MKTSWKLIALVVVGVLISGCQQKPTCNKPYILVGNECCLDENGDGICDKDKPIQTTLGTTSSIITTSLTTTSTSTTSIKLTTTTLMITCYNDSDCKEVKTRYCKGGVLDREIQENITTFICKNPGTLDAKCIENTTISHLIKNCQLHERCYKEECYDEDFILSTWYLYNIVPVWSNVGGYGYIDSVLLKAIYLGHPTKDPWAEVVIIPSNLILQEYQDVKEIRIARFRLPKYKVSYSKEEKKLTAFYNLDLSTKRLPSMGSYTLIISIYDSSDSEKYFATITRDIFVS